MQSRITRILYLGFILMGTYYAFRGDLMQLFTMWGIAFAFDPFDAKVAWNDRKWWQRGVFIFQITVVILAFLGANWTQIKSGVLDGWMGQ
ncbi:MAG: hypothetical protein RL151_1248 [Bacteroidota bacterium]